MEDSILTSIKKLLGITEDYTHFDTDITMHINTAFSVLTQIGVGPATGFHITGANETWSSFIGEPSFVEMIKSYVYLRVRMLFDPPVNGSLIDAMNKQIDQYEWRIMVALDPTETDNEGEETQVNG